MLKENLLDLNKNGKKGDWWFTEKDATILLKWGDKLNEVAAFRLLPPEPDGFIDSSTGYNIAWNGNREAPTLNKILHCFKGGQLQPFWSGFLIKGVMVDA